MRIYCEDGDTEVGNTGRYADTHGLKNERLISQMIQEHR